MVHSSVVTVLENGRKTRGLASKVAEIVRNEPNLFPELMFGLWHVEGEIRGLAANAVLKVTDDQPAMLQPFKAELLGLMPEAHPAIVRWHLAQLMPRLKFNRKERAQAVEHLREYLQDRSGIVRVCAITSLFELSAGDADLREEVNALLRSYVRSGTAAMKARARKLLARSKE